MWVAVAVKLLTFFSAKNIRILYIESAKTVNEMTLNELVKLTMLWTTVPWFIIGYCDCNIPVFLAKAWPCLAPSGIWYTLQRCYGVKQYRCSEGTFIWFRRAGQIWPLPAPHTHMHACLHTCTHYPNPITSRQNVFLIILKKCNIATDKALFSSEKCWYLSYFSTKTYVVGTHQKRLAVVLLMSTHNKCCEALLMSTHNICFCQEIRKMLCGYSLLSVAMV